MTRRLLVLGGEGFLGRSVMAAAAGRRDTLAAVRDDLLDAAAPGALDGFQAVVDCSDTACGRRLDVERA